MTIHLGNVPAGATLYIPFATYDKTNGASVTMTGLAVTDIEIYKDGSTTQRASDAGYALLDTDGIDFDSLTGIHGFSIDLSDNTDSGFYAVGSFFWVVVSSITVDSQTVNFIPATFRIVAAENTAGYPVGDMVKISGDGTAADNLEAACDGNTYNVGGGAVVAASVTGAVGSVTGAVGSVTGAVGSVGAGGITASSIATDAIDADALKADAVDEILDEVVEGTTTLRQAIKLLLSFVSAKVSGAGTTTVTFRDIGDTKDRITMTVDADGNRSAVTRDGS